MWDVCGAVSVSKRHRNMYLSYLSLRRSHRRRLLQLLLYSCTTSSAHSPSLPLTSTFVDPLPWVCFSLSTSSLPFSIHLPFIASLMWWCRVIWGSRLRGKGMGWEWIERVERKAEQRGKGEAAAGGRRSWGDDENSAPPPHPHPPVTSLSAHPSPSLVKEMVNGKLKEMLQREGGIKVPFFAIKYPPVPFGDKLKSHFWLKSLLPRLQQVQDHCRKTAASTKDVSFYDYTV